MAACTKGTTPPQKKETIKAAEMTQEEKVARFSGYELVNHEEGYGNCWQNEEGMQILESDFTADLNLFVEAWNKAVGLAKPYYKPEGLDRSSVISELAFLPVEFTIETRLPLLVRIIDFLAEVKI